MEQESPSNGRDEPGRDRAPRVGVFLPALGSIGGEDLEVAAAARLAEDLGFDSAWVGDHLAFHTPSIEAFIAATVAATVTDRISVGLGVLIPALRQPAWVARQIGSLQFVAGDRLALGVGVGGEAPAEWAAAGVDPATRARRTDALLAALPALLRGEPTTIGAPFDLEVPALLPQGTVSPPVWVGGRSTAALDRTLRHGDGWLGMWLDPDRVRAAAAYLRDGAGERGRPVPRIGAMVFCAIADDGERAHAQAARVLQAQYALPYARMRRYVAAGTRAEVERQLTALAQAGVDEFVLFPVSTHWQRHYEEFAPLRDRLLRDAAAPAPEA